MRFRGLMEAFTISVALTSKRPGPTCCDRKLANKCAPSSTSASSAITTTLYAIRTSCLSKRARAANVRLSRLSTCFHKGR